MHLVVINMKSQMNLVVINSTNKIINVLFEHKSDMLTKGEWVQFREWHTFLTDAKRATAEVRASHRTAPVDTEQPHQLQSAPPSL